MIESYKLFWQNYFKLEERSRRRDFWWPFLINTILSGIIGIIIFSLSRLFPHSDMIYNIIEVMINLVILIGTYTAAVRRFHDIGKSMVIPCIFLVISLLGIYNNLFSNNQTSQLSLQTQNQVLNGILSVVAIILSLFIIVICIMSLVYSVRDSQKGPNQYGPNPKGE